jgi:Ca2+-binding RTX toxin-like protein
MANLLNQTYTLGTIADDLITGTSGDDSLSGGGGNDTITGGLGNDTIDGGAGINTYIIQGTADAFTRRAVYDSATGTTYWQITDLVAGGADTLNASNEGVDALRNIQQLQFYLPDWTLESTVVLDDFANTADVTNQQIEFGSWVNGRINFYGDQDWLRVSETAGEKYVLFAGAGTAGGTIFNFNGSWISGGSILTFTPSITQISDIQIHNYYLSSDNPSGSSTPQNSSAYSFVLRRELDGTTGNDVLTAGTNYEYLVGGAGDDTLNGSVRSDYLSGGDGNDVLTGGAGNDDLDGGAGNANVAVFSGNKADYSFQWAGSSDLGAKVSHLNNGVDGIDTLKNIQILQFADGNVVLDTQSSDPFGLLPNNIGQAMVGSLPGTRNGYWPDVDAFSQKFTGLNINSTLRIKLTTSGDYGNVYFHFNLIGTQDQLNFVDANNSNQTYTEFQGYGGQSWFVTPQYWGGSQLAFAGDRADVIVSGYAQGDFGTFLNYSITVDRVQLGTANADTIIGDGKATYIDAQAGNDTVTGSDLLGEEIQGGAGDDILNGGGGNDTLVGGAGANTLNGGVGDDILDVRQATSGANGVNDTVDGGDGVDTLLINTSQNIANMSISNVEILQGDGGVSSLTPSAVLAKGFTTANNITFRLDPNLANGGTLDASGLSGTLNLRGTNQSDILKGNDQANIIYLQSDSVLGSGLGVDTVVAGGGDDTIVWSTLTYAQANQIFSSISTSTRTYFIDGNIDGGAGTDKLSLSFDSTAWYDGFGGSYAAYSQTPWSVDISHMTLTGVENLALTGMVSGALYSPNEVRLSAAQISSLTTLSGITALGIVGGGTVDLSKLASLGISNWHFADNSSYTITGTSSIDTFTLGAGIMTVDAGDGNDTITLEGKTSVVDTINGGAGTDTLVIRGTDVDLSGATLSSIESIQVASQSLSLTADQWAATSNVTRVSGSNTAYILSITAPGTTTLAADSVYSGLTGSSGDDRLIGNAFDNILVGGAGNDELTGNAGNDRLVTGAGIDILSGGEGNDTLVVTDKTIVRDQLDGGAGTDTLQVSNGQDFTAATITGMEILSGSGTVTMTPEQLASFQSVNGVTVQLSGTSSTFSLGATQLTNGASVLLPQSDPTLSAGPGILGSKGDDIIGGSAGADIIYGGRGADRIDGGAGADLLIGGSGTDTLIGGAGDDVFRVEAAEFAGGTVYCDIIDGGAGNDTLEVNFSDAWRAFQINPGTVSNIEHLVVNNPIYCTVTVSADNWNSLTSFTSSYNTSPYNMPSLNINGNGNDINFNNVDVGSNIGKLNLTGTYFNIDASNITLGPTANITLDTARGYHSISVNNFDSILLSGGNDYLQVNGDNSFTVNAGAGDDIIAVSSVMSGHLVAAIDGGAGNDTLDLSNSGFVDLTQSTLTNIESVKYGTSTLVLTDAQLNSWSFDGSGAKFTKTGNAIVGTTGNDSYSGDGTGSFKGGAGNDSISNVNTAVFSGNMNEYDFVRNGATLTVQHARGTPIDGTDTLTGVMNLQFADTTMVIDDAPNGYTGSAQFPQLTLASYDKPISAKKDYTQDTDVFAATLAPNSPLAIDASSQGGNNWNINFTDVASGQQLSFKSLVNGQIYVTYYSWMAPGDSSKWLPGFQTGDGFKAYQGGDVVLQYNLEGGIQDYSFTLRYLDDYAGSVSTLGTMDPLVGEVRGYIGDVGDSDWVRTSLIAGTNYEFHLNGVASGGGTLLDPSLALMDSQGRVVSAGINIQANAVGGDDVIVFRPVVSDTYYLAVKDVGGINLGSWTLTQTSLDMIAGNTSTTERIEWTPAQTFTVSSEVNTLGDHDWFKVWLDKGLTYDFRALGSSTGMGNNLADPQLSVRSLTGNLLATDDNSGIGTDANLIFRASDSGWYYLDAGAAGNMSKGTYTITGSSLADDYGNSVLTNGVVQIGTPKNGLISFTGDSDWFKVGMTAGQTYVIDLTGDMSANATLSPLTDPLLIIRDATGAIIFKADDFGGSLNSRAYFTPTTDGAYILEATSAFKYDVGGYQLSVTVAPPDDYVNKVSEAIANPAGAGALTLGSASSGIIGSPGDHDMFSLNLVAGNVYQINANGLSGHAGTLADPYLRVFDAQGHLVDFANNGGMGRDSQLYLAPTNTGTYYFEVSSNQDKGLGTYQITANLRALPPDDVPNDMSTQVILAPGDSFAGQLLTHNDQDWFGINLGAQQNYVFRVQAADSGKGSLLDPVLEIHAADGTLLQSNDNSLISHEPFIVFNPTDAGKYYLVVKAANGQTDTGSYTLLTRAPDDFSDTKAGAASIMLDQTVDGAIQWAYGSYGVRAADSVGVAADADVDWFQFHATAGQVLSVNVQAAANSTLSRPMVEIVDANNQTVGYGDGLETTNGKAVATFSAAADGTYYARVIDGAGATGAYQLTLAAGDASDEDSAGPVVLDFVNQGAIAVAQTTAKIGLVGDTDTFDLALQANHNYRFETVAVRDGATAPLQSATLGLSWHASGQATSQVIDASLPTGEPSAFETAAFTPATSGNISVTIKPSDSTQTGQYKLRVVDLGTVTADTQPDQVANYVDATNGVLAINDNIAGVINTPTDHDLYAINLTAGNVYDFNVKGFADGLGTLAEATLQLLDANGGLVTSGHFDATTGREQMGVSVFADGRYYLSVGAANQPGNTGSFLLDTRLRDLSSNAVDDISADTRSGVSVSPGKPATGTINYAGDTDWISANLQAGKVYVIDLLANGDGAGGTLTDGYLRILDSSGNEVALDDNSGAGLDARLFFTPKADQTYYFEVGGTGASTGTYTLRTRELYSGVADPLQSAQWYLPALGIDKLNNQLSGAGITIGMVDDGIDSTHPDLQTQINLSLSYDAAYKTNDGSNKIPYPTYPTGDFHGTMVAGIMVAAANNQTGIVGIAPDAEVASTRVKWTWDQITDALGKQYQFDVSNNSWSATSPFGDNFNSTTLTFAYQALRHGVEAGRGGNGTVFVFSAGNSAASGDNTNYHNFQNAREVIAVAAANSDGSLANFSTPGASVLVGAYGVDLLTTDRHENGLGMNTTGNYTSFTGTSAAAPVVSGVVALMLEANPNLGYRDVQQILALSASHPDSQTWKVNGASNLNLGGMHFNDGMGFGLVDAYSAVQLAQTWTMSSTAINEATASARAYNLNAAIPDGDGTSFSKTFHIDSAIQVEHIELGVDLRHSQLGDLVIELISPDGTVSRLMDRPTVNADQPFGLSGTDSGVPNHLLWDFSSVQFMGEQAVGDWTVVVKDVSAEQTGTLNSLSLRVFGQLANGNDTYVFTEEGFKQQTNYVLQDESGIDTINASVMVHDIYVDLSADVISSQGVTYQIADWTVIEQAFTGAGNDRLVGNAADNWLQGRAGNDTLQGDAGNDILDGGTGSDTVVYAGAMAEYNVSYDPNTTHITVVDTKTSNGNDGTDSLIGIERIVFSDGDMSLSAMVGNTPPVAKAGLFDTPVAVGVGMGINFDLPSDAFTDATGGTAGLTISVSNASGGELPSWMSYDSHTHKIYGVPPEGQKGRIKLLVEAIDEYGEKASKQLEFQLGDNQAPILDQAKELVLSEDAGHVALGLTAPVDPEGTAVTVSVLEIPSQGAILDKMGNTLTVGSVLTAVDITELFYQTAADKNGNSGYFRYQATDASGVVAESGVHIFIDPVNDAPRFNVPNSQLTINYSSGTSTVPLDVAIPTDPESTINQAKVVELPALGVVTLDGALVTVGEILSIAQLSHLSFTLNENVNGPIGSLGIQATDPQGLATTWTLGLTVQGQNYSSIGTAAADQMYGSIGADILYGMGGNDTIVGNAGDDRILGGAGDDMLVGGSGNDSLDGGSGNDTLIGGTGNDVMAGGPGNDYYYVDVAGDQVVEVLARGAGGIDTVETSINFTAPANVENLVAAAGAAINLTGNELANTLAGNDQANILLGGAGADTLLGFAGNDTLDGGAGIDRMAGGTGNDLYFVDSRSDIIMENPGEGIDSVQAVCSYSLPSNVENIILLEGGDWSAGGNSLNNIIVGNSGNNTLSGGMGADTLVGGLGDDTYVLNDLLDTISDTGGNDTIRTPLSMELPTGIERLELTGLAGVSGIGNAADNTLIGNAGDNYLEGGAGVDTLTGGAGGDGFFIAYNGTGLAADKVTDFVSGEDLLMIDLASFGISAQQLGLTSSGMVGADTFVQSAGAVALDANDFFLYDTAQMVLKVDFDGSGPGAAVDVVRLAGLSAAHIQASDIYISI